MSPVEIFHHAAQAAAHGRPPRGVLAVMLLTVVIEIVWRLFIARKGYDAQGAAATLGVAGGNLVFGVATSLALGAIFAFAYALAPVHWPLRDWRTWLIGFFAVEFAYYWFHRLSHRVRWLWASHAVHHTPEEMTLLSAIRLGWTNLLSGGWLTYAPLVLMGFDPRLVLGLLAFDLRYQFFLHTEAVGRLGPLEWIFNTPSHHRVHHGSNERYLDKNYGGVLILYDRMFKTLAEERPDDPIRYGLVHPVSSKNPVALALGEWRRLVGDMKEARSIGAAFKIAAGPPQQPRRAGLKAPGRTPRV